MKLHYRQNYWDVPELKSEFIRFLNDMFGLDLSLWDTLGYWDDNYRPFSFFSGDTLVSNVCVYSMDMTVEGQRTRVAQISAVATRPEYRRRRLGSQLIHDAIEWAETNHDFFFLFADTDAFPFYRAAGFRRVDEQKARLSVAGDSPQPGLVKLDMKDARHRDTMSRLASKRSPVSDRLGVHNKRLLMFWALYALSECVYHIPEIDTLILARRADDTLTIYDIVSEVMPPFKDVYPFIRDPDDRVVELLFMPDRLHLRDEEYVKVTENGTHVLGDFAFDNGRFIFPFTAHA